MLNEFPNNFFNFFDEFFGISSEGIEYGHIIARAVVIYIFGILLIRLGKSRMLARITAFDTMLAFVIGSLLSRAITHPPLFLKIVVACIVLIGLHWLFSFLSSRIETFGPGIKGTSRVLIKDGKILWSAMRKSHLSEKDLFQAIRLHAHLENIEKVKTAVLERNGDISVILKEEENKNED